MQDVSEVKLYIHDMKKLLSFILLFIWAVSVFAVPANRKPFVVKQSDGTMLSVILKGDVAMSMYTTLDCI